MGFIWDLIQQSQLSSHAARADTLEGRVHQLEDELYNVQLTLHSLMVALEERFGEDIDKDGRVG